MASKYIQKFPIPGQFPDILHDFVREVLRDQPENIFEYGAAYFTALDEVSPLGSKYRHDVQENVTLSKPFALFFETNDQLVLPLLLLLIHCILICNCRRAPTRISLSFVNRE